MVTASACWPFRPNRAAPRMSTVFGGRLQLRRHSSSAQEEPGHHYMAEVATNAFWR
jgi:hypothetical protein